jgi:hypothetical protein
MLQRKLHWRRLRSFEPCLPNDGQHLHDEQRLLLEALRRRRLYEWLVLRAKWRRLRRELGMLRGTLQ